MKRKITVLLCLTILLCTGCGSSEPPKSGAGAENSFTQAESPAQENASVNGESPAQDNDPVNGESPAQDNGPVKEEAPSRDSAPSRDEDAVQMPDFEMTLLNGDVVSFSDYLGKKVIINFWATWCGPCVGEMPAFQRLTEEYPDDLAILAINCGEESATVEKFIQKNSYTFSVVPDEDGGLQSMFGGIQSIPVTIIIDEEGYIVTSHVGAADADTMYAVYKEDLGL